MITCSSSSFFYLQLKEGIHSYEVKLSEFANQTLMVSTSLWWEPLTDIISWQRGERWRSKNTLILMAYGQRALLSLDGRPQFSRTSSRKHFFEISRTSYSSLRTNSWTVCVEISRILPYSLFSRVHFENKELIHYWKTFVKSDDLPGGVNRKLVHYQWGASTSEFRYSIHHLGETQKNIVSDVVTSQP